MASRDRGALRLFAGGALGLVLLTLSAYLPALHGGFVWDDDDYVTENDTLRSLDGLRRIWLEPRSIPQYYPLVHTSFWIEYRLWQLDPLGYHLVNVLLHALGAVLLWAVLRRLGVGGAWLAAAVFALHPVHVESVAWITERKNVLSGVFYLASLLALLPLAGLTRTGAAAGKATWDGRRYGAALVLFAAALASKSVTFSLPAALLLLVYWQRGRLAGRDAALAAPMLAMGLAAGLHTAFLERVHVGAQGAAWDLSLVDRILIATRALWFYAGKLLWPEPLIFNYPRWDVDPAAPWQWPFPLLTAAVVAVLFFGRRRLGRGPLVAVLFFAGTLFPALGFFDVYPMRYSFVADHFQYLASLGLMVAAVAAGHALLARQRWWRRSVGVALAAVVVAVYFGLTFLQSLAYWDAETLWRATIAANPGSWMARDNLAALLHKRAREAEGQGQPREAAALRAEATVQLERSLELHPDSQAYDALGQVRLQERRFEDAVELFRASLGRNADQPTVRLNLGTALGALGRETEQLAELQRALEMAPDEVAALRNLASLYLTARSPELRDARQARELAARACELTGRRDPWQLGLLAEAEAALGNFESAVRVIEEALDLVRGSQHPPRLAATLRAKRDEYRHRLE